MEKSVAIKKLHKIIGRGFAYRVNPKGACREERDAAKAELKPANAERERLRGEVEARRQAILADDVEYQEKLKAFQAARKRGEQLLSLCHSYRVTVGTTHSAGGFGFFSVKAEGDNWEEIVEKLTEPKSGTAS